MFYLANTARTLATVTATVLLVSLIAVLGEVAEARGEAADAAPPQQRDQADHERGRDRRSEADDDRRRRRPDHRGGPRGRGYGGYPPYQVIHTPLQEEQVAQVLDVLQEMQPHVADWLKTSREEDPERFEAAITRIGPHALHMAHLRETDPRAFELRRKEHELGIQAMHLAKEARSDDEAESKQARAQLKRILEEQFDVRTQLLEHETAELERRLEHLREQLQEQQAERDSVVERRLEMVLRFSRRGWRGRDGRDDEHDKDERPDRSEHSDQSDGD
ncbi:MAG: hypothetical protein WD294_09960 [Phycisphaeraceae bacterium]